MRRVAIFIALALAVAGLGAVATDTARLTILYTNDTHGHLLPFSYPQPTGAGSEAAGLSARTNIGGIARRATLFKQVQRELAPAEVPVWLIDAGDFSDGTPFSTEYRGEADVAAMNAAGYMFATIGNHEFNYPLAQTKKLIGLARYHILCANAVETATGRLLAPASRIEKVGEIRVGLFGLVTRESATYPAAKEGVTILDEIETARKVLAELRLQADIIVLISHCGDEKDRELASAVAGIDVIIGSHSHTRLPVGEFVWWSDEIRADDINGTVIVQAHQWAGELGRLDLLFARNPQGGWRIDRYRVRLLPVTASVADDPDVAAVVDRFWKPIAPKYGEIVGTAAADFTARGDDEAPYNLVADAVRETFHAEIGLENMGGVRAPLVAGPITRADLIAMDPFDNFVMTFKISGRDLKAVLRRYTPAVSGIRYRVENGELTEASVNGQPVQDDRLYTGTTNSYFAGFAFRDAKVELIKTDRRRLDVLIEYVRARGTIRPVYDGRRVVVRTR